MSTTAVRTAQPTPAASEQPMEQSTKQPTEQPAARNPAQRALEGQPGARPRRVPQHVRAALSSPTDGIQSPASKAVNSLRRKAHPKVLPKPQVLGSLFEAMKPAAADRSGRE
ncbi:hypothetical protein LPJ61_002168 [Coemansia biformis]|uniref:Uncharacterized protein n=1 Tax=Coemansia biformis TaxID=1286918 RepID=A0A9W8CYX4_9FUNG|nr:hypothetical protein LPJ61_002168 [Coemansia biformis]